MVVISLISIVLFGGMALIVGVRQAGRTVAAQHHNARSLQALSKDYRRDLQQATHITLGEDSSLTLRDNRDQNITYTLSDQDLHRTAETPDGVIDREVYRFQTPIRISWQVTPTWLEDREAITMLIHLAPAPNREVDERPLHILGTPLQLQPVVTPSPPAQTDAPTTQRAISGEADVSRLAEVTP